jgi:hypothetical protein
MTSDLIQTNLLLVCAVGLGGSIIGLLGLLLSPKRGWTALGFLFSLLLFGGAAAAAWLGLPPSLTIGLTVLAGLAAFLASLRCTALVRFGSWLLARARSVRFQGLVMLALCPAFLLWWSQQAEQHLPPLDEHNMLPGIEVDPSYLQDVHHVQAVTDHGQSVRLYTLPLESIPADELRWVEQKTVRARDLAQKQIRTAAPDSNYNCHGWVFAAGHFWVRGVDVPRILEGNGYSPVSVPRVGDVIVYRDSAGAILHTGLVRSVEDGLILIESKWGWLGRYVHRPEDQCYGDDFTYYHTDRGSHRLQGLGGETPHLTRVKH